LAWGQAAEVSVTRKLFRTGESEYYTNKAPCRRKDIIELFLGTGIGPDSYSLIEQGRIDLVLSSKPDERRYIFEDAAGIIKYKSRKDAAVRKMERADANLLRLQDTIIEIRRRINSLRRQANAAQRYRRFQDELRGLELRLALLKYNERSAEHTALATSVSPKSRTRVTERLTSLGTGWNLGVESDGRGPRYPSPPGSREVGRDRASAAMPGAGPKGGMQDP